MDEFIKDCLSCPFRRPFVFGEFVGDICSHPSFDEEDNVRVIWQSDFTDCDRKVDLPPIWCPLPKKNNIEE